MRQLSLQCTEMFGCTKFKQNDTYTFPEVLYFHKIMRIFTKYDFHNNNNVIVMAPYFLSRPILLIISTVINRLN